MDADGADDLHSPDGPPLVVASTPRGGDRTNSTQVATTSSPNSTKHSEGAEGADAGSPPTGGTDFEIWSAQSQEPLIFRCDDAADCDAWVSAIENAIAGALNAVTPRDVNDAESVAAAFAALEGFGGSASRTSSASSPGSGRSTRSVSGASPQKGSNRRIEREVMKELDKSGVQGVVKRNPTCADCGSPKVEWASINLGVVLCIECSGGHRNLGSHVSKVRSLFLDSSTWTPPQLALMTAVGNDLFNRHWECNLPDGAKPTATSTLDDKIVFIRRKYVDRRYVRPDLFRAHRLSELGAAEGDLSAIDRDTHAGGAVLDSGASTTTIIPQSEIVQMHSAVASGDVEAVVHLLGDHGSEIVFACLPGLSKILSNLSASVTTSMDALNALALHQFFRNYGTSS